MNILLTVTGQTGAGKTTLVERLGQRGWQTMHTGDMFRNGNFPDKTTNGGMTSPSLDKYIYERLKKMLDTPYNSISFFAVESMPRSLPQVAWLKGVTQINTVVIPIYLYARREVRTARVRSRDLCKPDRRQVDEEKLNNEDGPLSEVRSEMERTIGVTMLDTTTDMPIEYGVGAIKLLGHMQQCSENLYNRKTTSPLGACAPSLLAATNRELGEMGNAFLEGQGKEKVTEELVDTLWFLLLTAGAMGISPIDITKMYKKKQAINDFRHDTGSKPGAYI